MLVFPMLFSLQFLLRLAGKMLLKVVCHFRASTNVEKITLISRCDYYIYRVYYEGLETLKPGIEILETTPSGKSANVNNKNGKVCAVVSLLLINQ